MLYMGPAGPSSSRNLMLIMGRLAAHRDLMRGEPRRPHKARWGCSERGVSLQWNSENAGLRWGPTTGLGNGKVCISASMKDRECHRWSGYRRKGRSWTC
jgi:hypothetical protein